MGTLTADIPRLPEHCDHKLPTSCRLSSIPFCCACADERAHSASYPTYIDGIGFVQRGNRWQRYCWFCKGIVYCHFPCPAWSQTDATLEFWENRVAATNLRPAQTRIPENPDQTDFLQRWYEFHSGYRIVTRDDGTEERIAVLGEPFGDVSPGQLPRTLDELRAGRERSAADQLQHITVQEDVAESGPSLEDTLDNMFAAAEAEQTRRAQPTTSQTTALQTVPTPEQDRAFQNPRADGQVMQTIDSSYREREQQRISREQQERRISALRRELHRMRNGIERVISGLRELGEIIPDSDTATERLTNLGRTLDAVSAIQPPSLSTVAGISDREAPAPPAGHVYRDRALANVQQRYDEAQTQLQQAQRYRDQALQQFNTAQVNLEASEADLVEHRDQVSQLRREQRTAENYTRIFGTREDMERQGAEWESPIGGMFTRAWERFRVAEEVRREDRIIREVLEDELRVGAQLSAQIPDETPVAANTSHEDQLDEYYTMLRQQNWMQPPSAQTDHGNFPTNMLNALRDPNDTASADTSVAVDIPLAELDTTSPAQADPPRMTQLERLLRNTAEPQRSAIIARMTENGTAQALEETAAPAAVNLWRRLVEPHIGLRPPYDYEGDSDSDSGTEEGRGDQGLDAPDSGRPEPKDDEEMTVKLDCKICYTQVADTAVLPCGHLVMCKFCSDQHSPVMEHDRTRPRRPANCPVCRKRIKQKVRIYRT